MKERNTELLSCANMRHESTRVKSTRKEKSANVPEAAHPADSYGGAVGVMGAMLSRLSTISVAHHSQCRESMLRPRDSMLSRHFSRVECRGQYAAKAWHPLGTVGTCLLC